MTKFIFVTGGVISSLGKGLTAASIGFLLQSRGFKVKLRKFDPYLNVDPGTMSPHQHGEVFVTEDGAETDLDLGYYERFTDSDAVRDDSITAGRLYSDLLIGERRGDYLGNTVQVIPHVTNLIKSFICKDSDRYDFVLCEIGGTVGDLEGQPFLEAIRQLGYEKGGKSVAYIHLTLVPYVRSAKESKTKPTQHSVRQLNSMGIQPNLILCRSEDRISPEQCRKIAILCNVKEEFVIPIYDADNIYQIPIMFFDMKVDLHLLNHFSIFGARDPSLACWYNIIDSLKTATRSVTVGLVGKYTGNSDSYKSLVESLEHGGIANRAKVEIKVVDSLKLSDDSEVYRVISACDGIVVPGGFGDRGIEGKIRAIRYVREHKIPFLGICLGMQLAVVEIMRNVLGKSDANSMEFSPGGTIVVGMLCEWEVGDLCHTLGNDVGGTMRLGAYECTLVPGSQAHSIYGSAKVVERHRHRYEINIEYKELMESAGVLFSGSYKGVLLEIMEYRRHPWFIGVQFHPELKSRPFKPHPLLNSFIKQLVCNKYVRES